ncbi:M20/M25/M40 family metallo-hydrolase [Kordiimonas gwangyangensis]|uniref:M20/M25/M40 family metallo-hydrolase n=2 Tax=Kordiimonas gwangyangensis TaxID=288022 RepID=UPI000360EE12|nr:M20/M25/M40 family metallo-hydrolase [Kordiimonas gwangyangensis]
MKKIYRQFLAATVAFGAIAPVATASDVPFQAEAREILSDSIAIRTVMGYGNVPKFAHYLEDKFLAAGFAREDVTLIPVGETMAMLVRFKGDGRSGKAPIVLSAHLDVVEAIPEDWERDPYTLIEEDGFLFGRGVSDNKFGVAMLATTFLRLKAEGFVPSRDLVIAFSGDEETSMASTMVLAKRLAEEVKPEFAIVADGGGGLLDEDGKPVSFMVDSAEKTYASFTVTATNPGGHSSLPRKDNAIYDLAKALVKLDAFEFPVMYSDLTLSYFEKSAPLIGGDVGAAMARFAKNPKDKKAAATLRALPEYVGTTGTTCVTTMLKGGHAENALPQSATATVNCRIFPGVGVAKTLETLKGVVANDSLTWTILDNPTESDASPLREDVFGAVERAVHNRFADIPVIPHMASGASDSLHFRAAGIPSYTLTGIFMKAEDEFAHGLNERVPTDNIPGALKMWHDLVTDLAGK